MSDLLLVIPPVAYSRQEEVVLDKDFSTNLTAYLAHFSNVAVLCPPLVGRPSPDPHGVRLTEVTGHDRAEVVFLPEPYREDRYLRFYRQTHRLLASRIDGSRHLLFSPHAPLDWSTLAARIARLKGRPYDMEADWDLQNVSHFLWKGRPLGLNKIRKYALMKWHDRTYRDCMRGSSVALLQGGDVYEAYRTVAPNPRNVLNVQVSRADLVSADQADRKAERVLRKDRLDIVYAGRATAMKGPHQWLDTLDLLRSRQVAFNATWFGGGDLLEELRGRVRASALCGFVHFPGPVDRETSMRATKEADLFLFCHRTAESPRNLVEALSCAAPLIGFGRAYAKGLTNRHGGGIYAAIDDSSCLADIVTMLDKDRHELASLIRAARNSGSLFDRDEAILERISLLKEFA